MKIILIGWKINAPYYIALGPLVCVGSNFGILDLRSKQKHNFEEDHQMTPAALEKIKHQNCTEIADADKDDNTSWPVGFGELKTIRQYSKYTF